MRNPFLILLGMLLAGHAQAGQIEGGIIARVDMPGLTVRSSADAEYVGSPNFSIQYPLSNHLWGLHQIAGVDENSFNHNYPTYNGDISGPTNYGECHAATIWIETDVFFTDGVNWLAAVCAPEEPPQCGCTPIIIDLEGSNYPLTGWEDGVEFDIDNDGVLDRISWTAAGRRLGFLWLDRDGDSVVSPPELFGSLDAANGFVLGTFARGPSTT